MISRESVVEAINKATEPFLIEGGTAFSLYRLNNNNLRLRLTPQNSISKAYNNYGNDGEEVTVVKWFEDFWLFVEIQFLNPTGTLITLSVFQGEDIDETKTQLFRAEWDDYADGNASHAQPHWHFLTNNLVERKAIEFGELLGGEKETFEEFIDEHINSIIDVSEFHFAMNADWTKSNIHAHSIEDENMLANWFGGLLGYLKLELAYLKSRH